jgi:flagellar biosynthetic protein FlhB
MADSAPDRTLPATPHRIEKARKDGQVARSRDLAHLAVLGGGIALLAAFAPQLTAWLQALLARGLRFDASLVVTPASMGERLTDLATPMLMVLLPLGGVVALLALVTTVLAGGWNWSFKPLQPKFEKIDPFGGFVRLFSLDQLTNTLKACLLALILGAVGAALLWSNWVQHAQLLTLPLPQALVGSGTLLRNGLLTLVGVLVMFALVDVPLQRQLLLRRLRMNLQEIKQEFKEVEGNAEVKQRRRGLMREMANRRMLGKVATADLVVMNPTHYAVALKYDEARGGAPRLVAKGADLLALRIRDLAREAKVPVLQAPPLARALYAHCELDQEIPARLFAAVAQVLAWVYQLRDAVAAGRQAAAAPPVPDVPADMDPANADKAATAAVATIRQDPEL